MLIVALQHSGFDPSFAVGGDLGEAGTNAHHGSGAAFVAEADESDGSLLEYNPDVAVVTNIEADHLDFFGSEAAYTQVFDDFVERLKPGGALVACADDPGAAALAERSAALGVRVLRYGSAPAGGAGTPPQIGNLAGALLDWEQQGTGAVAHIQLAGEAHPRAMRLGVPGRHMALNALGAVLAAIDAGAPAEAVLDGLAGFEGVRRRFELIGTAAGVRVFDDYAHHPTEVRAALSALRTVAQQDTSVFAHKDFRPGVRGGAQHRRSGIPARRLCRAGTAAGGNQWRDHRRIHHRAGPLPAGLLDGRRAGRGDGEAGRRGGDDGSGRRDAARPGDHRRASP